MKSNRWNLIGPGGVWQVECSRRTIELEEMLARSNQEKQSLLEEKEIIVQQLQREKEFLEVS